MPFPPKPPRGPSRPPRSGDSSSKKGGFKRPAAPRDGAPERASGPRRGGTLKPVARDGSRETVRDTGGWSPDATPRGRIDDAQRGGRRDERGGYQGRSGGDDRRGSFGDKPRPRRDDDRGGYQARPAGDDRRGSFGDKPRPRRDDDRGGYQARPAGDDRRGSFVDKPRPRRDDDRGGYQARPAGDDRRGSFGDKPRPRSDDDRGGYQGRPGGDDRRGGFGDKPRPRRDDDRGGYQPRTGGDDRRGGFGDKPRGAFGDKPRGSFGDKPRGSFGDKPRGQFGDKPKGAWGDKTRARHDDQRGPRHGGERGNDRGGFGARPPRDDAQPAAPRREEPTPYQRIELDGAFEISPDGERIAKLLARAGIASRRDVERLIVDGRVTINDELVLTPATILTTLKGVAVDGKPVAEPEAGRLWAFHKPDGLITAERDPAGRPTIYTALRNALPPGTPRLMPVGRLDFNTEGLLLLTNDGELKRAMELPSTGVPRTYRARTFGDITQPQLEELMQGIEIDGFHYGPINANMERRTGRNQWVEVTLTEGKNREVRRVLEHLGLQVSRLMRISYGPFMLGDLPRGAAVPLPQKAVEQFRKTLKTAPVTVPEAPEAPGADD